MTYPESPLNHEQFKPEACMRQTLAAFDPCIGVPLADTGGVDVERRYLAADVYATLGERGANDHIRQVDERVRSTINEVGGLPPDQQLESWASIGELNRGAGVRLGRALAGRAAELGVVSRVGTDAVRERMELPLRFPRVGNLGEYIRKRPLFGTSKPDGRMLVCVADPAGEDEQLSVVDLDALHAANPEFVREQIISYHISQALSLLGGLIVNRDRMHAAPLEVVAPGFLAAAVSEPFMAERQYALDQAMTTLRWLISLPVPAYTRELHNRTVHDLRMEITVGQRGGTVLSEWARHRRDCTGEPDTARDTAHATLWAIAAFDTIRPVTLQHNVSDEDLALLDAPSNSVRGAMRSYDQIAEYRATADRATAHAGILEAATGMDSVEAAESLLREQAPGAWEQLERLRHMVDTGGQFVSFNNAVEHVVLQLRMDNRSGRQWDAHRFIAEIGRSFALVVREEDARALDAYVNTIDYHFGFDKNPLLALSLPIYVAMYAKKWAAENGEQLGPILGTPSERMVSQVNDVLNGLAEDQRNQASIYAEHAASLPGDLAALESFLQANNISHDDLAILETVMQGAEDNDVGRRRLYNALFNTLYLGRRGIIDLSLPVHKLALGELFRDPESQAHIDRVLSALVQPRE